MEIKLNPNTNFRLIKQGNSLRLEIDEKPTEILRGFNKLANVPEYPKPVKARKANLKWGGRKKLLTEHIKIAKPSEVGLNELAKKLYGYKISTTDKRKMAKTLRGLGYRITRTGPWGKHIAIK